MKKRSNNTDNLSNGITITDSISLTINSTSSITPALLLIITAAAGVFSFVFSFLTLFNFEYYGKPIFVAVGIMFAVCSLIFMFPSRAKLLLIPVYAIIGYEVYKYRNAIVYGYASLINTIASDIHITTSNRSYYSIPEDVDPVMSLTIFFIFLFVIITSIVCYNTIIKPRFIFAFLSTFPFIETGLYFGLAPSHPAFFVLIAYWISVFAMRIAGNQFQSTTAQPVFVRKKNIFVSSGNLKNNVIETIGIITLAFVICIFAVTSLILKIFAYERSSEVNDVRNNIKTTISDFSIESMINAFTEKSGSLPVGKQSHLGSLNAVKFDNQTDLTINVSDELYTNLYLRGFVGKDFKNNTWYAINDKTINSNKEMFDSFREENIFPQQFNYLNNKILFETGLYPVSPSRITIMTKFKKSGYLFIPYGANSKGFDMKDDAYIQNDVLSTYSYSMYTAPDTKNDISYIEDNRNLFTQNEAFRKVESEYNKFAVSNYLSLPDNEYMHKLHERFSDIPQYNGSNMQEIITSIRNTLHENATYSLTPGTTPSQYDLTYYLLVENHKGYCSHFATAGTVLARMAGIPARYAEGYVVIPSDFNDDNKKDAGYSIDIPDSRAHAWSEFYIDGYGWVPVEFTPGYSDGIASAQSEASQTTTSQTPGSTSQVTTTPVTTEPSTDITTTAEKHNNPAADDTQTQTTQITSVSDPGSSSQSDASSSSASVILLTVKIILLLFVITAAVIFLIMTRHIICVRRIILSMRTGSNSKNVLNAYAYIKKLLLYKGFDQGNMLPLDFAAYIEKNASDFCDTEGLRKVIESALKAGFSNEEISQEESKHAVAFANHLASSIYNSLNKKDKLKFRYISNLIR
ncbi:MAG: transglutaminase-like domain-containing protein [Oscillospiraceae bacterium]|nr:transglutaminase-like domain-containing protein [Oscillospiraceae bacterium]